MDVYFLLQNNVGLTHTKVVFLPILLKNNFHNRTNKTRAVSLLTILILNI